MSILLIIGIILAIIIIIFLLAWILGVARSRGSKTLNVEGDIAGNVLIVYDPGLSGGTKTAAFQIAHELNVRNYMVKLAGIRSNDAIDLTSYEFFVVGSPTYGANPTGAMKSYLNILAFPDDIIAGIFTLAGSPAEDSNLVMAKMLENKDVSVKVSTKYGKSAWGAPSDKNLYIKFVEQLLK